MTESPTSVRVEPCPKRVRAYLDGRLVVDTLRPVLVWERRNYPTYYLPADDVRAELVPSGRQTDAATFGAATLYDVSVGGAVATDAAVRYLDSDVPGIRELVRLDWKAMSQWFEEDEPVFVHPRDPYTRVDILASSRHVRIELDGVTVAESRQPRILFETRLPPRWYLPLTEVRLELLRPSERTTQCPYKGTANYFSVDTGVRLHEDVVWTYRSPLPESQKIAGLVAFYDERVDVHLDGVLQERPRRPG